MGLERVRAVIVDDAEGIAARLDADMQKTVDSLRRPLARGAPAGASVAVHPGPLADEDAEGFEEVGILDEAQKNSGTDTNTMPPAKKFRSAPWSATQCRPPGEPGAVMASRSGKAARSTSTASRSPCSGRAVGRGVRDAGVVPACQRPARRRPDRQRQVRLPLPRVSLDLATGCPERQRVRTADHVSRRPPPPRATWSSRSEDSEDHGSADVRPRFTTSTRRAAPALSEGRTIGVLEARMTDAVRHAVRA